MIIAINEIIVFHVSEWIVNIIDKSTRSLVRQEVGHNTWKSRCKVKRKPTSSKDIKINITPIYLQVV